MSGKVFILLPVHNRRAITERFIDSILLQTYTNYQLILIDDGSSDGTADMVRDKLPSRKLEVIKGDGDWWWAGSLQQGINWLKNHDACSSDVVLMINDDVTFPRNFLRNGVAFIRKHPDTLLLSRYFDEQTGKVIESGVAADWSRLKFPVAACQEEINCLSTRGLFLTFDALLRMGRLHPFLLPHYCSDYEYTMRSGRRGLKMRTVQNVYLVPDFLATGVRDGVGGSLVDQLRTMFSKRCAYNPVYWTSFILLSCPVRWVLPNIVRVWVSAVKRLVRHLRFRTNVI